FSQATRSRSPIGSPLSVTKEKPLPQRRRRQVSASGRTITSPLSSASRATSLRCAMASTTPTERHRCRLAAWPVVGQHRACDRWAMRPMALCCIGLLLAQCAGLAFAQSGSPPPPSPITFQPGSALTTVSGQVVLGGTDLYGVAAKAGQTLLVSV